MLRLQLFGPPRIVLDGQEMSIPRRRTRALLYYLALQPQPVGRDQLTTLLWPDHDRVTARQQLRTTLHSLRGLLPDALQALDDRLQLQAAVDARQLQELLAAPTISRDQLAAVLEPLHGGLLEGFALPDSDLFEDWLAAERERSRLLVLRGWSRLARSAEQDGDYQAALTALLRALALDPLQEDLQRDAMRVQYRAGDRVGAIRRFEQLQELLDRELGVPPMRETRELYDQLITDTLPVPAALRPPAAAPAAALPALADSRLPFSGREREHALLTQAVAAQRVALLEGVPGIGKTRLAEEFLRTCSGQTLTLAGRELEQHTPYQALTAALHELTQHADWKATLAALGLQPIWLREAARLLPELYPSDDARPADEARLWEALTQLLLAVARRRPLQLLVDDLHWLDASTVGWLGYLARRQDGEPLTIVMTGRPADPRSTAALLVRTLLREQRLVRIVLERLPPEATFAIARELNPVFAHPLAEWLERTAEGNPYIIAELVRHARAAGLVTADYTPNLARLSAAGPLVPQTVYSLIEARLSRLSEPARRVLDAAVAAGRDFSFAVTARAAGLSEDAALDALDELRAARLVIPLTDGTYRFDHSLTMEVAYHEVGEARHRVLHRRVAEALEALNREHLDDVAAQIAAHYSEGGVPARAAVYAMRAARRAAALAAWHEAADQYRAALAGVSAAERSEVMLLEGQARYRSGDVAAASDLFAEALAAAVTPRGALDARLELARSYIPQGRYADVIALVEPLAQHTSPAEQAAALFITGVALSLRGDLQAGLERLMQADQLLDGDPTADLMTQATVRFELGNAAAQLGDLERAIAEYRRAMAGADADPRHSALDMRILTRNNLAYHLLLLGRPDAADAVLAEAAKLAEQYGVIAMSVYLDSTAGEIALARGETAAARRSFERGRALALRVNMPERVAGITANLGLVDLAAGDREAARTQLQEALEQAETLTAPQLVTQIEIWLAGLLPAAQAEPLLQRAEQRAVAHGRRLLLDQIHRLRAERTAAPA
jgi:DNA-binding SARP family transcriptional activator/predicted ATPase